MYDDDDNYGETAKPGPARVTVFRVQPDHRDGLKYEITFTGPPGMEHAAELSKQLQEIVRAMKRDRFQSNYMLRLPAKIEVDVVEKPKAKAKRAKR